MNSPHRSYFSHLEHVTWDPGDICDVIWDGFGGGTGWDVGGNYGQSAERMVTLFDRVLSFEPCAESFTVLAREWSGHPRVQVFFLAVADHDGTAELRLTEGSALYGQLLPAGTGMDTGWWWGDEVCRREVPCATVDTLAAEHGVPDFIKVDTEGGEARVMAGAGQVLAAGRTAWLIETHSDSLRQQCQQALEGYGYDVSPVRAVPGEVYLRAFPR